MKLGHRFILLGAVLALSSCSSASPVNESFPLALDDATRELAEMRSRPVSLRRPVVVLAGYLDPGIGSWWVARQMRLLTGDDRILTVQFLTCSDFDECRRRLVSAVEEALPSDDDAWTREVDVVAVSMGGVVARYAAAHGHGSDPERKRLRIARLFTISSPHQGAHLAELPCFLPLHAQLRGGSRFMNDLNAADRERGYDIYPYVRLGDLVVGASNAAPRGRVAWWVGDVPLQPSHAFAASDPRILADIARRLRGEPSYATKPAAPLPSSL